MLIVGYHVAKTGGTTVMHHIQKNLGHDAYFGYGQHPASDRFFSGKPLWEEMTDADRQDVKFVFGHQITDMVLGGTSGPDIGLFTVIRDPFEHFVSQYKYHLSVIRGQGQHVGARDYFQNWQQNRVSGELFKFMPNLYPEKGAAYDRDKALHILRQFRFLCATEKLTEQSAPLCRELGIPPVEGRYRVSKGQADLEGLTRDEVYDRCPVDREIHEALVSATEPDRAGSLLAYDDAAFRASLTRLRDSYDRGRAVKTAYTKLANFFRANDMIEAAQLFLALKGANNPKFGPIVQARPLPGRLRMKLAIARSEKEKAAVYVRCNFPGLARACYEKAIALNENYVDAYVGYAVVLKRLGLQAQARDAAQQALAIDAGNAGAKQFLETLAG